MMTTFGLLAVPLMNRGLADPDITDGWIGAILFVVTFLFLTIFSIWNKKRNDRLNALATAASPAEGKVMEGESEPLVTLDV